MYFFFSIHNIKKELSFNIRFEEKNNKKLMQKSLKKKKLALRKI